MTDKILCPWCGAEMTEGIVYHTNLSWKAWLSCTNDGCNAEGPMQKGETKLKALVAARAATMRRYTPPIKPMTLEEAKTSAKNDWLWIEDRLVNSTCGFHSPDGVWGWINVLGDSYGKTWRCWERKPTDEERSAAGWES